MCRPVPAKQPVVGGLVRSYTPEQLLPTGTPLIKAVANEGPNATVAPPLALTEMVTGDDISDGILKVLE